MAYNFERVFRWKIIDGVKSKGTEKVVFLTEQVQKRAEKY
jgi:hypothetical protein